MQSRQEWRIDRGPVLCDPGVGSDRERPEAVLDARHRPPSTTAPFRSTDDLRKRKGCPETFTSKVFKCVHVADEGVGVGPLCPFKVFCDLNY